MISIFGRNHIIDIAVIPTIVVIFALDALDGYIARKRNQISKLGEIFDTVADRIIENTLYIYFTVTGLLPLWIPITVMARGFITDALQHYGEYSKNNCAHTISRSRFSRALYGFIKMTVFTTLASATIFKDPRLEQASYILAMISVIYCILRGLPFLDLIPSIAKLRRLLTVWLNQKS